MGGQDSRRAGLTRTAAAKRSKESIPWGPASTRAPGRPPLPALPYAHSKPVCRRQAGLPRGTGLDRRRRKKMRPPEKLISALYNSNGLQIRNRLPFSNLCEKRRKTKGEALFLHGFYAQGKLATARCASFFLRCPDETRRGHLTRVPPTTRARTDCLKQKPIGGREPAGLLTRTPSHKDFGPPVSSRPVPASTARRSPGRRSAANAPSPTSRLVPPKPLWRKCCRRQLDARHGRPRPAPPA